MLSDSVILVSHGEWVNMRDFIRLAGLCKDTFLLIPLMASSRCALLRVDTSCPLLSRFCPRLRCAEGGCCDRGGCCDGGGCSGVVDRCGVEGRSGVEAVEAGRFR